MTGQSGLRFDIYERIQLPEDLVGIQQLEELELMPHIQVLEENEHALLRGNLWLTGQYIAEDGSSGKTIEHFIPVEITLPKNRVRRLEDISVEIDNFDIDLLSPRSLNVTGVLSLQGIESFTSLGETVASAEEEVVFVHRAKPLQQQLEVTGEASLISAATESTEVTKSEASNQVMELREQAGNDVEQVQVVERIEAKPPQSTFGAMHSNESAQIIASIDAAEQSRAETNVETVAESISPSIQPSSSASTLLESEPTKRPESPAGAVETLAEKEVAGEEAAVMAMAELPVEDTFEERPTAAPAEEREMKIAIAGKSSQESNDHFYVERLCSCDRIT